MFRFWMSLVLACWASTAMASEPVAAGFQLVSRDGVRQRHARFLLVRDEYRVEIRDAQTGTIERWERDPAGRLFYLRLFPDLGKAIEFQPSDLGDAGVVDDWETIRSIIGPRVLQSLERHGVGTVDGRRVDEYGGDLDGVQVSVAWLPDVDLPARVTRDLGSNGTELRLVSLTSGPEASMLLLSPTDLTTYEWIDFADLGDRRGDSAVDRLVRQSGLNLHLH
jgi:hypothetical protein